MMETDRKNRAFMPIGFIILNLNTMTNSTWHDQTAYVNFYMGHPIVKQNQNIDSLLNADIYKKYR